MQYHTKDCHVYHVLNLRSTNEWIRKSPHCPCFTYVSFNYYKRLIPSQSQHYRALITSITTKNIHSNKIHFLKKELILSMVSAKSNRCQSIYQSLLHPPSSTSYIQKHTTETYQFLSLKWMNEWHLCCIRRTSMKDVVDQYKDVWKNIFLEITRVPKVFRGHVGHLDQQNDHKVIRSE